MKRSTKKPVVLSNPRIESVRKEALGQEIGAAGLKHSGGYLYEEFERNLQGQRAATVYREMRDNWALVGGILLIMKRIMRQVVKRTVPFVDKEGTTPKAEDQARADFVNECLSDLDKTEMELADEVRTYIEFGYAPMEIVYKRRLGIKNDPLKSSRFNDGKIGWARIALRGQDSVTHWDLDTDNGDILGMFQIPAPTYTERLIPIEKLLLFRATAEKNNPEGRSLLRSLYFAWLAVKRLTEIGGIGAERDLTGLAVIRAPGRIMLPGASTQDAQVYNALKKMGRDVRNDEQGCIILPSDVDPDTKEKLYSFELMASPGTRQFDIVGMINQFEQRAAMALASDFLLLGHEKVGSYSLGEAKSDIYAMVIDGLLEAEDGVWNTQAIPRLAKLNGWPLDRLPKRTHGKVQSTDVQALSQILDSYTKAGGMLDPKLDAYIREELGWPEAEAEVGIDVPGAPPTPEPKPKPTPDAQSPEQQQQQDEADAQLPKTATTVNVAPQVHVHMPEQAAQKPPTVQVNVEKDRPDVHVHVDPTPITVLAETPPAPNVTVENNIAAPVVKTPDVKVNVAAPEVKVEHHQHTTVQPAQVDVSVEATLSKEPTEKTVKYDVHDRVASVTERPLK